MNLHHWTPADGPLPDTLKTLPDGHQVTLYGDFAPGGLTGTLDSDRDFWFGGKSGAWIAGIDRLKPTCAEWLSTVPAWDGALVVADKSDYLWARMPDDRYGLHPTEPDEWYTAAELDADKELAPITVLIDADGHHIGETR